MIILDNAPDDKVALGTPHGLSLLLDRCNVLARLRQPLLDGCELLSEAQHPPGGAGALAGHPDQGGVSSGHAGSSFKATPRKGTGLGAFGTKTRVKSRA
jgi:hypothetical protein